MPYGFTCALLNSNSWEGLKFYTVRQFCTAARWFWRHIVWNQIPFLHLLVVSLGKSFPFWSCAINLALIHWSRDWLCTLHGTDHALIMWLIMYWRRSWSYTDIGNMQALIIQRTMQRKRGKQWLLVWFDVTAWFIPRGQQLNFPLLLYHQCRY